MKVSHFYYLPYLIDEKKNSISKYNTILFSKVENECVVVVISYKNK